MIYIVKINDTEYEVEVERGQASIAKTTVVSEKITPVQISATAPAPVPAASVPAVPAEAEGKLIRSPMPGTIIDVKARAGANVKKGDLILVIEAMKMENEVLAPADGVVAQIFVATGSSVNTDDALISIK